MEERRIREVVQAVRGAFEDDAERPESLAAYLEQHGVSRLDVVEALEDIQRVDMPDEDEAVGTVSLLRLALERFGTAMGGAARGDASA
jgi:hypothetical protein